MNARSMGRHPSHLDHAHASPHTSGSGVRGAASDRHARPPISVTGQDGRSRRGSGAARSTAPFAAVIRAAGHRLGQGLDALRPSRPGPGQPDAISSLTPAQRDAFLVLSAFDQRHAVRVWRRVAAASPADRDLGVAALLHDLAKSGPPGLPSRVRLPDRVALVLLRRLAPRLLDRVGAFDRRVPRWRAGLVLAVHHPALGAAWTAALGSSPRVCWLIAHHHDPAPVSDPALRLLMAADEAG